MNKTILKLLFIFCFQGMMGQNNCTHQGKLFSNYENFKNNKAIDSVCLDNSQDKLRIKTYSIQIQENNQTRKYKTDGKIWGVRRDKELFRYLDVKTTLGFMGYARVVYNSDKLVLYSYSDWEGYGLYQTTTYFYSQGIQAEPKALKMKNIENDFYNIPFLEAVKKLDDLFAQEENGTYLITSLFQKYFTDKN